MLEKIKPKPIEPPKTPWSEKRSITVNGLEQHTHDFISAEARARNMNNSQFCKEIFERLESGEF